MAEKKTKEIKETKREETHKKIESETKLTITFTPSELVKIKLLAEIAHGEDPAVYCKKILQQHLADRLYLVR